MSKIRKALKEAKRIVVKMGSSQLVSLESGLNVATIALLAHEFSALKKQGREMIFVTSGAVAMGARKLGFKQKPKDVRKKQACASVGQVVLISLYAELFGLKDLNIGQILLSKDVLEHEKRRQNVLNTFQTMLGLGILPVVNENDSVAIEEIENIARFGDNDNLASVVAALIDADLLILLSDIDGYYDSNPKNNPSAKLISEIKTITPSIKQNAKGSGSEVGTGGMQTKIEAALFATKHGCDMVIANGKDPRIISRILKGEDVGTWFVAKK